MAWTILRPNFFMQTVPQYIQGLSFFSLSGQGKISLVDLRDVSAVATAALTEKAHEGKEYVLTGARSIPGPEEGCQQESSRQKDRKTGYR